MRAHQWTEKGQARTLRVLAVAFALLTSLAACTESPKTAFDWPNATYYTVVVRPGDTVSDIAVRYDVTLGTMLRMNDLEQKSAIYPGEVLRIPPGGHLTRTAVLRDAESSHVYAAPRDNRDAVQTTPLKPVRTAHVDVQPRPTYVAPRVADSGARFIWPVSGTVIDNFGAISGGEKNDGINIAAATGTPIRAAQSGTISYAGNELRNYGNLILIKHDDGYITAYAHADRISVSKGQHVEQGEVIGYAGSSGDVTRPQLHFEIRRDSRPVDPRLFLAAVS
jgi:murein DD-endopeptidase MepM/ murein hydrolase activator NlpD